MNQRSLFEVDHATHGFGVDLDGDRFMDVEITVSNARSLKKAKQEAWDFIRQIIIEMDEKSLNEILKERAQRIAAASS